MTFIYAEELKRKYRVLGHFYNLRIGDRIFKCRSLLEIVSFQEEYDFDAMPDAVVVMMNPGSSRPLDIAYEPREYSVDEILSGFLDKDKIKHQILNAKQHEREAAAIIWTTDLSYDYVKINAEYRS